MKGPGQDAQPGLGDDPEGALRATEEPVGAGAGAGTGQPPRLPYTDGGNGAHGLDEVLDVGPEGGEVPGGARGEPAAERGVLEGLGEVPQREAMLGELSLEARP